MLVPDPDTTQKLDHGGYSPFDPNPNHDSNLDPYCMIFKEDGSGFIFDMDPDLYHDV